ncbi:MAG: acyltransferase [Bacteroidia bacterium]|nr:acyltransferase [Bacteroidia bacterium]
MTLPVTTPSHTVHGLSWLRGLASLMVCFFHVKKYIWKEVNPDLFTRLCMEGYLGVYVFFVISGFVIPYSMHAKQYTVSKFFRFLAKRMLRIEPPYVIFVLILFVWTWGLYHWKGWGKPCLYDARQFLLNITYLAPFFQVKWISLIFWTLAVEFQFYILTGLSFGLMMKGRTYRYPLMLLFTALGFVIPESYLTVFNNYVYFLVGFQSFLFYTGNIKWKEYLLSLCCALVYTWFFELEMAVPFVLLTLAGIHFLNYRSWLSDFLGNISYSLYLTHGLAGGAVAIFSIGVMNATWTFVTAIAVSILVAWMYYTLVEKPFLRWSKRLKY